MDNTIYTTNLLNKETNEDRIFFSRKHSLCFRGIAALIIMIQHISGAYGITYFTPLGGTGVAMFLIASGYGVNESYKKKGVAKFWENKLSKVFFPFVCTKLLIMLLDNISVTSSYIIQPVYWYLSFILINYIFYYIYVKIDFFHRRKNLYWIIMALFVLLLCQEIKAEQALSFYTGILISDNYIKIHKFIGKKWTWIIPLCLGISMFIIKQFPLVRSFYGTHIYFIIQLLIKLPCALGLILLCYYIKNIYYLKLLESIGKISLMIYLIHMAFLPIIKISDNIFINMLIYLLIVFLVSVLLNNMLVFPNNKLLIWRKRKSE